MRAFTPTAAQVAQLTTALMAAGEAPRLGPIDASLAELTTDTGATDWNAIDGMAEDWSDEESYGGCECELDWNCGRHGYTETPEDRMATAWRRDVEGPEMPF
jgi:hypothetical protein